MAEIAKLKRSPVPGWSVLVVVVWPLMSIGTLRLTTGSWRGITWEGFMRLTPQTIASWYGVILGGFVTAYVFGREYTDATARNMLTAPVRREYFVISKLTVLLAWVFGLSVLSIAAQAGYATVLRLDGFAWKYVADALRRGVLVTAPIAATLPIVAWLAVVSRGYLAPMIFSAVAFTSGVLFLQAGWERWWPWAMPFAVAGLAWVPGDFTSALTAGSWVILAAVFAVGTAALIVQIDFADNLE